MNTKKIINIMLTLNIDYLENKTNLSSDKIIYTYENFSEASC